MFGGIAAKIRQYLDTGSGDDVDTAPRPIGRRDSRHLQAGRRISIVVDEVRASLVLNNLSTRGASGEVDIVPDRGATVIVQFERGIAAKGVVKWVSDNRIGIAFMVCLPMDIVDGTIRKWAHRSPREPRFAIARTAILAVGSLKLPVSITNISSGGLRLQTPFPLVPGQQVRVEAGSMPPLHGVVRWSRPDSAGIKLETPISLDEFDSATEACRVHPGQDV